VGLVHGTNVGFLSLLRGLGFKSLTYVVDEPDAFNLNMIKAKQSKSNEAGNGLGLSSEFK